MKDNEILIVRSHRLAPDQCPHCHKTLDACTSVNSDGSKPRAEHSVTVCAYCHTLLMFTEAGLQYAPQEALDGFPVQIREAIEKALNGTIQIRNGPVLSA